MNALKIFKEEQNNEYMCMFAIRLIENMIHLYCKGTDVEKSLMRKVSDLNILIVTLKSHLDVILKLDQGYLREDTKYLLNFLYDRFSPIREHQNDFSERIYNFEGGTISLDFSNDYDFSNCTFKNMKFVERFFFWLTGSVTFENCNFKEKIEIKILEKSCLHFKSCDIDTELYIYTPSFKDVAKKYQESLLPCVKIENSKINKFTNFSGTILDSFIIENTVFNGYTKFSDMLVKREFRVKESKFRDFVDFQNVGIDYLIRLEKVNINKVVFFKSYFNTISRIDFIDVKLQSDEYVRLSRRCVVKNNDYELEKICYLENLYKLNYNYKEKCYEVVPLENYHELITR